MPERIESGSAYSESLQLQDAGRPFLGVQFEKLHAIRFAAYGVIKRGMDMVLSAMLLVILSPTMLIIAIVVKIDSPGPVLFRQKRTGKDGKDFYILKFRSMAIDNDVMDARSEDKYTRVGEKLRKTSLDELPQLINVLVGQMSFIGPRPWMTEYWTNMTPEERERSRVRPGITGLAAAKGRNGLTIFQKIDYDLEYVHNFSLWQDVKVILLTVRQVTRGGEANVGKGGIHDEINALASRWQG